MHKINDSVVRKQRNKEKGMIDIADIQKSIKKYRESQSEEDMTVLFGVVRHYPENLPFDMVSEISTVVDKNNEDCGSNLFVIINMLFEYPGIYFKLNEEEKQKLITGMEGYYSFPLLLETTRSFSGRFESIVIDMKPHYLEKYGIELLKNEFCVFNVPGDRYREFLIDNLDKPHYLKKSAIYDRITERHNYFSINVEGLYKTLLYMESKGEDFIKEILQKKDKQLLHCFYWLDVRPELSNDEKIPQEYIEKYQQYMIRKMEFAGMQLKDVLNFAGNNNYTRNKKTYFTNSYFSYALEREPETADIIMNHFVNSGAKQELINDLQILRNKKEREDLSEIIDSEEKVKKMKRI